jgi:hypothetical protein
MKAVDPEGTTTLNIRGITAAMRNAGLDVRRIDEKSVVKMKKRQDDEREKRRGRNRTPWFWGGPDWKNKGDENRKEKENGEEPIEEDRILSGDKLVDGTGGRWVELPLVF